MVLQTLSTTGNSDDVVLPTRSRTVMKDEEPHVGHPNVVQSLAHSYNERARKHVVSRQSPLLRTLECISSHRQLR
jgi:hypothetical protein